MSKRRGNPAGSTHGFIYSQGIFTTIDDPLAVGDTEPFGINAQGTITGWYQGPDTQHEDRGWRAVVRRDADSLVSPSCEKSTTDLLPCCSGCCNGLTVDNVWSAARLQERAMAQ